MPAAGEHPREREKEPLEPGGCRAVPRASQGCPSPSAMGWFLCLLSLPNWHLPDPCPAFSPVTFLVPRYRGAGLTALSCSHSMGAVDGCSRGSQLSHSALGGRGPSSILKVEERQGQLILQTKEEQQS